MDAAVETPIAEPIIETPAAPAQPVDPASEALAKGDFQAFKRAENARLSQTAKTPDPKPAELVAPVAPAAAPAPAVTPEARATSKRQQQINDYERTIVELRAENARLAAPLQQQQPLQTPAEPAKPTQREYERFKAMPDAPKLADFDQYEDWNIEMAAFVADRRYAERTQQQQEHQHREAADRGLAEASTTWSGRLAAARQQDADYDTKTGAFLAAITIGTPIGDVVFHSEVGTELARHLAEHPEDVQRIIRLHPNQQLRELGRLEARFDANPAPAQTTPQPKYVSSAPAPPAVLGSPSVAPADPALRALKDGDFLAFKRAENARLAKR